MNTVELGNAMIRIGAPMEWQGTPKMNLNLAVTSQFSRLHHADPLYGSYRDIVSKDLSGNLLGNENFAQYVVWFSCTKECN